MAFNADLYEKYPSLKKLEEQGDDYVEWNDGREEALLAYIKSHHSHTQMHNNPALILSAMDDFAAQQDFLINIGSDKGRIVSDLVMKHKPHVLVEMGGYVGYSAIWFADTMRRAQANGNDKDDMPIQLWSLEFDERFAKIARQLIELAGLSDVVQVVLGAAADSLRMLKEDGRVAEGSVNFLFLDHDEALYKPDFETAWKELSVLKKGAVVVADNVVRPGAPDYREYVRNQEGLKSEGVKGMIMPGEFEDELEVTTIL